MKKIIIGLSGIFIAAMIIILFVNAQNSNLEGKKNQTEISKDCGNCPAASSCPKMVDGKKCDPAKCKEAGCDLAKCKEGKCDASACKATCAQGEPKKCGPASCNGCAKK